MRGHNIHFYGEFIKTYPVLEIRRGIKDGFRAN